MKISDPPTPLISLLAAGVAHLAFLQAPDALSTEATIGWYLAAILGVGYFVLFLLYLDKGRFSHPLAHVLSQGVAMFGLVLILVGAGYSTNVEPTVLKLGGVLPLGWSCSVIALLKEQAKLLVFKETNKRTPRFVGWLAALLCIFTAFQLACDLGIYSKGAGDMIKWALEIWLFIGLIDLGLTWRGIAKAAAAKQG